MNLNYRFSSSTCGFKKTKKPDLAVIYSPNPCIYAGVFTKNQVRAACVDENKNLLKRKQKIKAIIVNSGNANACTGKAGIQAVKQTQGIAAKLLKIKTNEILVASTGIIGIKLDLNKMKKGLMSAIPKLSEKNLKSAAKAILTTDQYEKIVSFKNKDFQIFGFAKGAGMIHPNMATMLCYFFTNLQMPQSLLQSALKESTFLSFNNISVDGDMSTNDMVILLSNNLSKVKVKSINSLVYKKFKQALTDLSTELAKQIVIDGEGASKLIDVRVIGAKSVSSANEIAKSISSSVLFKCAVNGSDPNWGRAASRIGTTNSKIDQNKLDIFFNKTKVFTKGNPAQFNRNRLYKEIKRSKEVKVTVNLNLGSKFGRAFGCNLSNKYVNFNSAYFT